MASKQQNNYLPLEIWILILCKLPVESLVRCRSVCKAWHHVIGTTFFVNTHLNYQKTSPNTNKYMLHVQLHYSTLSTDDSEAIFDDETTDSKLHYTFESFGTDSTPNRVMRIWGICDGLLCVSNKYYTAGNDIHLWNPICRKAKKLPKLEISVKKDVRFDKNGVMSFGYYDDDYQVIAICPFDNETSYVVSVYSLRSNCWRTFPSYPCFNFVTGDTFWAYQPTRFIDGTAYMLTFYNQVVVYFDIRHEISRQLELPEGNPTRSLGIYALEAYREKLAVFRCGEIEMSMWILTDKYSSTSPWEKKFVIKLPILFDSTRPVGFLHNGKYLVKTYFAKKKMTMYYLCDPESPKLTKFKPRDGRPDEYFYNVVSNCVESLLLLNEDSLDPFVGSAFVGSEMGSSCNSSRLFTLYNYQKH